MSKYDEYLKEVLEKTNSSLYYLHDEGGAFRYNSYEHECQLTYPKKITGKKLC